MRWPQEQRMQFIASRLIADGWINRAHLQKRFRISQPQASADFTRFQKLNPGAMSYNKSKRRYERAAILVGVMRPPCDEVPALKPVRLQRKRAKGWRAPADAVYVGRPTRWGNPYRVRAADGSPEYRILIPAITAAQAVDLYRTSLVDLLWKNSDLLRPLRGKDLICWCSPDQPCHADLLLELANLSPKALIKRMIEMGRRGT